MANADPTHSGSVCTCPTEGYAEDCPMARGGLGHVKACPAGRGACPCLPGSLAQAYCFHEERVAQNAFPEDRDRDD